MDKCSRLQLKYLLTALVGLVLLLQVVGCSFSASTTVPTVATARAVSTKETATTEVPALTQSQVRHISKELAPSVVEVEAVMSRTTGHEGTGVIYSSGGYIVTNNHVISSEVTEVVSKSITVTLSNGKKYSAVVVGRDASVDVAVLRIRVHNLTAAEFRTDLTNLAPGDVVVAIGKAEKLEHPVTSGRLIEVVEHANFDKLPGVHVAIESSAPVTFGNSGGPLVDSEGRVIGINTAETPDGKAISLPSDLVVQEIKRLLAG